MWLVHKGDAWNLRHVVLMTLEGSLITLVLVGGGEVRINLGSPEEAARAWRLAVARLHRLEQALIVGEVAHAREG